MAIQEMISRSRTAQQQFLSFSQEQVDAIVKAIAKAVFDHAEPLAKMAAEETRMGVYEHKISKNMGKARIIWNSLKGVVTVGALPDNSEPGIIKIAKPLGVVAAVTPCTNPIVTPMCNAMFALKCRNSIIIAPHPRAKKCAAHTVELFNAELKKLGAPDNLIQVIAEPTNELTGELMRSCDASVATGGMGMVKAAYSSGKPAYGVGAGNVQCIIDQGYDLGVAIPKILDGRAFDNGIICSGEQTIIAHRKDYDNVIAELRKNGAYFTADKDEVDRLRTALFPDGVMSRNLVGQSAAAVAEAAGLKIPEGTRVIVAEAAGTGKDDLLCKEKMCPVIASFRYDTFEEAVRIAGANLEVEGKGHSVAIHSDNREHARYAGEQLPVSRILMNQICATMNGGAFQNSLTPTTTLGCGSWGGNSVSENIGVKHFMNISRVAFPLDGQQPSDAEVWG